MNQEVVRGIYDDFLEDPKSFKFDVLWRLDGTTILESLWKLIELPALNEHVWMTFEKLNLEPTVKDLLEALEERKISGPIFRDLIQQKNGKHPKITCLRVDHIDDAVLEV